MKKTQHMLHGRKPPKLTSVSCGDKEALGLCWWECQSVPHCGEEYRGLLRKLNTELPYDPAVPPGYFPEGNENTDSKPTCPSVFTAALSPVAKIRKQPKCPSTDERRECGVCPVERSAQLSSAQLLGRARLCHPRNRSTPGLPVHHQLPEFTQTHVHRVTDAIQPSHPRSSPSPPAPSSLTCI